MRNKDVLKKLKNLPDNTKEYVDSKSLPILFLDDSNRTGDKLFPLLPDHNLVFLAGDAQFTDENGNINIIYGLCYSDLQSDGSKLLTEYRTSKSASISANGTLKSFDYIDEYTKTILTLFKNAPSGKVLVKNQNNTFEWVELPTNPDLSSYAPITSPVFKKSIRIGDVDPDKTLGENSIIASSYGEASGAYTLSNGKAAAARADYSHAEGYASMSKGIYSHAEGEQTGAIGQSSHSEGNGSSAKGIASHAEGYYTTSNGKYSHAEGYNTIATGDNQHVQGKYNIEDKANKYAHIVGNGYRDELNYTDHRSNGYTLDWSGNGWFAGKVTQEGTPAEDKDLTTKKYVDDTIVFKKLSSIIELNSGKKIINVEKFEDNKVYYFINDINTSTTTLVSISLYKNNEKVNTMVIYPNDRFITMGYKSSTNEFFSFSDMESVKYNVVNKTREYNNSRSVTKKADTDQVLTKTNTTAFTPTADYQPATKKYVDDGDLEATSAEVKAMLLEVLGGDYNGEKN